MTTGGGAVDKGFWSGGGGWGGWGGGRSGLRGWLEELVLEAAHLLATVLLLLRFGFGGVGLGRSVWGCGGGRFGGQEGDEVRGVGCDGAGVAGKGGVNVDGESGGTNS